MRLFGAVLVVCMLAFSADRASAQGYCPFLAFCDAQRSLSPKLRRLDRRHRLAGATGFSARMLRQMRCAVQPLHGAQHASLPPLVALTPGTAAPSPRANARRAMLAARAAVYTLRGCSFAQITTV
jgi:hypothetical protein